MASLLTLSARAAGQLPFALSWWGFTFPLGAFVAESLRLSKMLGWSSTFAIGVAAWLLLCFFWIVTAVPDGAWRGQRRDFPAASVSGCLPASAAAIV
jgi:tellurite resistance protein TehA-like permease